MQIRGPWSAEESVSFLRGSAIPLRLGVVRPDGGPLVLSLWFMPQDGAIWCATRRDAYVAGVLRCEPRCAFEVASDAPPSTFAPAVTPQNRIWCLKPPRA